jgi:hypothetical protein
MKPGNQKPLDYQDSRYGPFVPRGTCSAALAIILPSDESLGYHLRVPQGREDNSPPFQRWESKDQQTPKSRQGRQKAEVCPSRRNPKGAFVKRETQSRSERFTLHVSRATRHFPFRASNFEFQNEGLHPPNRLPFLLRRGCPCSTMSTHGEKGLCETQMIPLSVDGLYQDSA